MKRRRIAICSLSAIVLTAAVMAPATGGAGAATAAQAMRTIQA